MTDKLITNYIETESLILREVNPEVYKYVFKNYSNYELMQFFGFRTAEELLAEKERFAGGITTFNKSVLYFQLIKKTSQEVIGMCGFHTWYLQHDRAEIFYIINDDSNKQIGYTNEAMKAVINYGFDKMKLNRIEAFIGPANEASHKVISRAGFTREGCLRQHYYKNEVYQDSIAYSLLKEDNIS